MKLLKFFRKLSYNISHLYWRYFRSSIDYARHIGVKIGNNCFISTHDWSSEPYLIEIGNNVQVTQGVVFHTHGGAHVARREYPEFDVFGKIKLDDWCYIGARSQIMPGVTIGEGALIAAGSIVCKSVPSGEVWGGNPAKKICDVEDYIKRNISYNIDSKNKSFEEKKNLLLSLPNYKFINKSNI